MGKSPLVLAALGLGVSSTLVPIGAAHAAPATFPIICITSIDQSTIKITPRPVVVEAKGLTKQTITFQLYDSCKKSNEIDAAVVYSNGIQDYFGADIANVAPLGDGDFMVYAYAYFGSGDLDNEDANLWSPQIQVYGSTADQADGPEFHVLRASQLTTNATPEPVKKNHTLTVKGNLTRANLDTGKTAGYGKRKVDLQYRTKTGSYHKIKTVTSSSTGALKTTVKAGKSGYYRYVFAGSSTTASVKSASDYVKVT